MQRSAARPTSRLRNYPLLIGGAIVGVVLIIAVWGPLLAPLDPLERTAIVKLERGYVGPPFPVGAPGFPLGSDRFGRDMLSRLLWAVRPTMVMVLTVALVRLALGLAIGLIAGWSRGTAGRVLDSLIGGVLAIPTLLVALATIAVVGIERGLTAFILGLALTGWVETARVTAEQTRILRGQPFIEAVLALGGSSGHVLVRHVLRHLAPLTAMLLASEISAVLLLTVMLGFLGYYIGGGTWIIMSGDALPTAQRATEYPELGQMLSTALERVLDPTPLLIVGGAISFAILGFNLLAEGLRRRAERPASSADLLSWGVGQLWSPFERTLIRAIDAPRAGLWATAVVALVGAGSGAWWWWQAQPPPIPAAAAGTTSALAIPGSHAWASERRDPFGTLAQAAPRAAAPQQVWQIDVPGLIGGPAIAADGTVYQLSEAALHALSADGAELWAAPLPRPPVGSPALGQDGTIYVADLRGVLRAFGPDGAQRWEVASPARLEATGGPVIGPSGTIYFTIVDQVQAVSPEGQVLWVSPRADDPTETSPVLSPDERTVFLRTAAFDAQDGRRLAFELAPRDEAQFTDPSYFTGADGDIYYRYAHTVVEFVRDGDTATVATTTTWDASRATVFFPADSGAALNETIWLLYGAAVGDTRIIWLTPDGRLLGNVLLPLNRPKVLGVAPQGEVVLCGNSRGQVECSAHVPGRPEPTWSIDLPLGGQVIGVAMTDTRMYVATEAGSLVALE